MAKKVLLLIAGKGYQPVEYGDTKKELEDAGIEVVTGSDVEGQAYANDGTVAHVNVTLDEVDVDEYDGIFVIGGPGALEHLDRAEVYNIMRKAADEGKAYGAICISSRILARAGVLTGKQATGWDKDDKRNWDDENVLRRTWDNFLGIFK